VFHQHEQVVIVDARVLVEIVGGTGDQVGMSAAAAGDVVEDAAVFMALVIVDVAVENDNSRAEKFLPFFQKLAEGLFLRTSGVAAAKFFPVGRTGDHRVVKNQEDEVYSWGQSIQLGTEPVTLWAGEFLLRTVQNQHQAVSGAHGVEAALLELWKTSKIIAEGGLQIAFQVVVAEDGVDTDFVLAPERSFRVPDLPVLGNVSRVNDVPTDGNEGGVFLIDRCNQGVTNGGIGGFGVGGVMEARVPKGDKMEGGWHIQFQRDMTGSFGRWARLAYQ